MARKPATIEASKSKTTAVAVADKKAVGAAKDWKAEIAKYAERAQATAVQALGNWFSVRAGRLSFKGADIQDNAFDGIVLDVALENAYFEKSFDPDNPQTPDCFALGYDADELVPHPNSPSPQHENCPTCPQNKWGSGTRNGKASKGKACKNMRRIALLSGSDITVDGVQEADIGKLRVPVTSVANLNAHINSMKSKLGTSAPFVTVTHIAVEPDPKTQVKVLFQFPDVKNIHTFPDKVMPAVLARVREAEEQLMEPYPPRQEQDEEVAAPARSRGGKKTPEKRAKF